MDNQHENAIPPLLDRIGKRTRWDLPALNHPVYLRSYDHRATLSIVIPARNEAAGLGQLVLELSEAFDRLQNRPGHSGPPLLTYEILIVDDGSTDDTPRVLQELCAYYPKLRWLRLARSAGQSAALFAGFEAARGTWVAVLDADLQNPPRGTGQALGSLARPRRGLRLAAAAARFLGPPRCQLAGQSRPEQDSSRLDPGYRLLGAHLCPRPGPEVTPLPGRASILRPPAPA